MNDQKSNWISHLEWVVLFVTLLGGFYSVNSRIDNCNNRMDQFLMAWQQENVAWHQETKDFHGRLVSLEERSK